MKNLGKLTTLFLTILISISINAQKSKSFQGVITYDIAVEGDIDPSKKAFLPTQMTAFIKENMARMEIISVMKQVFINDKETMTQTLLMDIMGDKVAIQAKKEDIEKELEEAPALTFEETQETKEIAGYSCKKVKVTDEEGNITTLYYTTDIDYENPNWHSQYRDIKGVLMEYSSQMGEIKMTFTVKEVKKQKIKDSLFEIPSDYTIMTPEEAQAKFGM